MVVGIEAIHSLNNMDFSLRIQNLRKTVLDSIRKGKEPLKEKNENKMREVKKRGRPTLEERKNRGR